MENSVKYRLKFKKYSRVRFIGHLDLMNVFQRAINRAGLPISYSKGFNPHQQMSFALPLSLGYYSDGEYLDLEFDRKESSDNIIAGLNAALPQGLLVTHAIELGGGEKSAAALTIAASYEVVFPKEIILRDIDIETFLNKESILTTKKSGKKNVEVDIRPDIFKLELNEGAVFMLISAGSTKNLKADTVVSELCGHTGNEYLQHKYVYKRLDLFKNGEKGFSGLLDV